MGDDPLTINFSKSYMYSTNYGFQPNVSSSEIINCNRDYLLLTYLGVPFSGRRPRRQDWLKLIFLIRSKLTSWKANYLSLGDRLTLLNSILTSIPTYWIGCLSSAYLLG